MIQKEVIIIGGGPSGSACAWKLIQNGVDCLILDQHTFPRVKPCAGWITPEAVKDLQMNPADYPHSFTTFQSFAISFPRFSFKLRTKQHAIRRVEFDDWLLKRSGAPMQVHAVKNIRQEEGQYIIDDAFSAKYLVGAGGTYCPVYRTLFKQDAPKAREALVAAMEEEFRYDYTDDTCRLWFLENGLPGYSWYVPKSNGYLNIGVGGKASEINAKDDHLKRHWACLIEKVEQMGLVRSHDWQPVAHSYYVRQNLKEIRKGNAFLVGDSAGLATIDMGEGISPAIKSGLLAADAILRGSEYSLKVIPRYSAFSLLRHGFSF